MDSDEPASTSTLSGSEGESESNAAAGSVPPQSPVAAETSSDAICATLDRSALQNNLPLDFFTRLIWQESRFNPLSVSHAGAQGIAQFMPGTARMVGLVNPFDPVQALPKSAQLLRDLRTHFGNLGLAAAAYNAGPKRVEDWLAKRKPLPQETEAYVRIITGRPAQEWTSGDASTWDVAFRAPAPCARLAQPAPHRVPRVVAVRQPDRPVHPIVAAHQTDRPAAAARSPVHGVKFANLASSAVAAKNVAAKSSAPAEKNVATKSSAAAAKSVAAKSSITVTKNMAASNSVAAAKSVHARAHLTGASSARNSTAEVSRGGRREQPAASQRRPAPRSARLA